MKYLRPYKQHANLFYLNLLHDKTFPVLGQLGEPRSFDTFYKDRNLRTITV